MQKQNRKPGIHLHHTGLKSVATKKPVEWYWILIAKNGKTIARSSETYKRKGSAVRSIEIASDILSDHYGRYYDHTVVTGITEMVVY